MLSCCGYMAVVPFTPRPESFCKIKMTVGAREYKLVVPVNSGDATRAQAEVIEMPNRSMPPQSEADR